MLLTCIDSENLLGHKVSLSFSPPKFKAPVFICLCLHRAPHLAPGSCSAPPQRCSAPRPCLLWAASRSPASPSAAPPETDCLTGLYCCRPSWKCSAELLQTGGACHSSPCPCFHDLKDKTTLLKIQTTSIPCSNYKTTPRCSKSMQENFSQITLDVWGTNYMPKCNYLHKQIKSVL